MIKMISILIGACRQSNVSAKSSGASQILWFKKRHFYTEDNILLINIDRWECVQGIWH